MVNEREREWESDVNNVSKASEVSIEGRAAVGCIALRFMNLELSPKSLPLICEYLDWRRPGVPVPQKKKHIDPITHQMCWFSGTGGDRTLDQQAISLPSGRITHNWTDSMQKNKTFLPFKWSLKDSLCIVLSSTPSHSFSLLLCRHIFFVCPTGNELLSLLPPFLPLLLFCFDWQVWILVKVSCLSLLLSPCF